MKRLVSLLSIALIVCAMIPVATLPVSADLSLPVTSWSELKRAIEVRGATEVVLKNSIVKYPEDKPISLTHDVHFDWSGGKFAVPPKIINLSNERAFTIDAEKVTMSFNSVAADSDYIRIPKDNTEYRGGFIKVNSENTKIEGLRCENMSITSGSGAVIWVNNDLVTIEDCYFQHNIASDEGGAIYIGAGCEGVKINKTTFIDCNACYGGAIYVNGYKPEISGCTFEGCGVRYDGGAIYANDDADIKKCHFKYNTAEGYGGSICDDNGPGQVLISECDFEGGNCGAYGIWVYGDGDAKVEKCTPGDSNYYYNIEEIDSTLVSSIFSSGNIWIIGGVAVVAIAAIVLIVLKRRKKTA